MIDAYFKSSDKVRELSGRVVLLSIFSVFFGYYKINLEKIPFLDVPYPKASEVTGYIPGVSVILFVGSLYFFIVMLGLIIGEYAEYDEKKLSELTLKAKIGEIGSISDDLLPENQKRYLKLIETRVSNLHLARSGLLLRLTTDILFPAVSVGIAAYFELGNVIALVKNLLHL